MDSIGVSNRRHGNNSVLDKKKKKKRKKRTREGKRSSASSASASGSPDSTGQRRSKVHASQSCPSLVGSSVDQPRSHPNGQSPQMTDELKVNECLRWPAHSLYVENAFRTDLIGCFPVLGSTEDEEQERIAIYKMNRRKRYLAAQLALINKYPDVSIYASSSGSSSSGRSGPNEKLRINSNGTKLLYRSQSGTENVVKENCESHQNKYLANGDISHAIAESPTLNFDNQKKIFSGI